MNLQLDSEGYPTEESLNEIESFEVTDKDTAMELVNAIEEIWWKPSFGWHWRRGKLYLSTGGWSGNEDIINALSKNFFWTFFWKKSRRGGHYIFDIK
jgi:hypothetical protein